MRSFGGHEPKSSSAGSRRDAADAAPRPTSHGPRRRTVKRTGKRTCRDTFPVTCPAPGDKLRDKSGNKSDLSPPCRMPRRHL